MIGAINDVLSWRWTFHILGIAGLCLVPLAALALWEPKEVKKKRKARRKGKASYSIKVGGRGRSVVLVWVCIIRFRFSEKVTSEKLKVSFSFS